MSSIIYETFEKLSELTKLTKTDQGYSKFIQTGNLELFDYNHGYIYFEIYPYKEPFSNWNVKLAFSTIDDGDLDSWGKGDLKTKEKADEIVEQIANDIFKNMIAFPTIKELNAMLLKYGIYIT